MPLWAWELYQSVLVSKLQINSAGSRKPYKNAKLHSIIVYGCPKRRMTMFGKVTLSDGFEFAIQTRGKV